jgi:hypothetical protein
MPDWQSELSNFFEDNNKREQSEPLNADDMWTISSAYFSATVVPALEEIQYEIEKHGRETMVWGSADIAYIDVTYNGNREIKYVIRTDLPNLRPFTEIHFVDAGTGKVLISKGNFRVSKPDYTMDDITKDVIIKDFLSEYYAHHS